MEPIYPEYIEVKRWNEIEYFTFVRKKRPSDNKWFLIPVRVKNDLERKIGRGVLKAARINALDQFLKTVYSIMLFYIIPEEKEMEGQQFTFVDPDINQEDECDRLGLNF